MILATALTMFLSVVIGIAAISEKPDIDITALIILALLFGISYGYSKWKKKNISPVILVLISAVLGILFYGI
jgi:TctA family transporter